MNKDITLIYILGTRTNIVILHGMSDLTPLAFKFRVSRSLEPLVLEVGIIHVHRVRGLLRAMVGMDLQTVMWTVKGDTALLAILDPFLKEIEGQRVEELVLDGSVEGTSTVYGRVPNAGQVLLGSVVQFQGNLPSGEALLDLLESDIDNRRDAILR